MADESRFGPPVRERSKLCAALMRTPDQGLSDLAQVYELSADLDPAALRRLRDVLDALGKGLRLPPQDPFWQRLETVWSLLHAGAGQGGAVHTAKVPPRRVVTSAPLAPQRAAPPDPDHPDFRHDVMYSARAEADAAAAAAPAPRLPRDKTWKPSAPGVFEPEPDQHDTVTVVLAGDDKARLRAARAVLTWPLQRIAQLGAAVKSNRARGRPSLQQICEKFQLANASLVLFTLSTWQGRFDSDGALAAEYARLVEDFVKEYA